MAFTRSIYSIFHPIQLSWTDCSFLKRWPVEILKISKIGDMSQKILNISMSSWPIWIIFGAHHSAHHPLQFIPYNHRDQTTSSWSAGQLKSSQSAKSAKLHGKTWISPWVLIRFGICFHGIQALNLLYNASHTSVLNRPLLPEALASWNPQNQQKQRISTEKPQ